MAKARNAHEQRPNRGRDNAHVEGYSRTGAPTALASRCAAEATPTARGTIIAGPSQRGRGPALFRSFVQIPITKHRKEMADVIHW